MPHNAGFTPSSPNPFGPDLRGLLWTVLPGSLGVGAGLSAGIYLLLTGNWMAGWWALIAATWAASTVVERLDKADRLTRMELRVATVEALTEEIP